MRKGGGEGEGEGEGEEGDGEGEERGRRGGRLRKKEEVGRKGERGEQG